MIIYEYEEKRFGPSTSVFIILKYKFLDFLDSKFDILPIENTHHINFIIEKMFFTGIKVGGNGLFLR